MTKCAVRCAYKPWFLSKVIGKALKKRYKTPRTSATQRVSSSAIS